MHLFLHLWCGIRSGRVMCSFSRGCGAEKAAIVFALGQSPRYDRGDEGQKPGFPVARRVRGPPS